MCYWPAVIKLKTLVYFIYNLSKVLGFDVKIRQPVNLNLNLNFPNFLKSKKHVKCIKLSARMHTSEHAYNANLLLPNLIKIYCDQVDDSISSGGIFKMFAVMPGVISNDSKNYDYCPLSEIIIPLKASYISNIKFVITDENDDQLKFSAGFASYIKASILSGNDDNMTTDYLHS